MLIASIDQIAGASLLRAGLGCAAAAALVVSLAGCKDFARRLEPSEVAKYGGESGYMAARKKCSDEELAKLKERSTDNVSSVPEALVDECMKRQAPR